MTNITKRILLVDNDCDILRTLSRRLRLGGYAVVAVDNSDDALEAIDKEIFHAAIVDVRLEDENSDSDFSGLDVARCITETTPTIVHTAYETEITFQLWRRVGAEAIISKRDPDVVHSLIESVEELFADIIAINFELSIDDTELKPEEIADALEVPDEAQPKPEREDIEQLFLRLFKDATSVKIRPLLSKETETLRTPSGSVLANVHPTFESELQGSPRVVKFAYQKDIHAEAQNYAVLRRYLRGDRIPSLEGEAYCRQVGALCYTLLGVDDFGSIRHLNNMCVDPHVKTEDIITALDRLLNTSLGALYAEAKTERVNLIDLYENALSLTPEKLTTAAADFWQGALTESEIEFSEVDQRLPNPVSWYLDIGSSKQLFDVDAKMCLCHGDLHGFNIIVDSDGFAWLLDFSRSCNGHVLRDFAELETDVKLQLVDPDNIHAAYRCELDLLHNLENDRTTNSAQQTSRAFHIVSALRSFASGRLPAREFQFQYKVALLMHALNAVRLKTMTVGQKQVALFSAAMICKSLSKDFGT